jgi:hypothetical protein
MKIALRTVPEELLTQKLLIALQAAFMAVCSCTKTGRVSGESHTLNAFGCSRIKLTLHREMSDDSLSPTKWDYFLVPKTVIALWWKKRRELNLVYGNTSQNYTSAVVAERLLARYSRLAVSAKALSVWKHRPKHCLSANIGPNTVCLKTSARANCRWYLRAYTDITFAQSFSTFPIVLGVNTIEFCHEDI